MLTCPGPDLGEQLAQLTDKPGKSLHRMQDLRAKHSVALETVLQRRGQAVKLPARLGPIRR